MITEPIRRIIEENTIGLVATVAPDGSPAVSPKATMVIVDERTIAFSDLRSPQTVRNIRLNPAVELNFIDVFSRKAARVKGHATYYEKGSARYLERWVGPHTRSRPASGPRPWLSCCCRSRFRSCQARTPHSCTSRCWCSARKAASRAGTAAIVRLEIY